MVPDYKREFENERQRLAQLWDAYEQQGAELEQLKQKVLQMEISLWERDKYIDSMKESLSSRDAENLEIDIQKAVQREEGHTATDRIAELEQQAELHRIRFENLFKVAQGLEKERDQGEMLMRDKNREIDRLTRQLESANNKIEMLKDKA